MFGADPLEVLYKQKNINSKYFIKILIVITGKLGGKSNFLNSKDQNRVSIIYFDKKNSPGKHQIVQKGLGLSHILSAPRIQNPLFSNLRNDTDETQRSKSFKKMRDLPHTLTPINKLVVNDIASIKSKFYGGGAMTTRQVHLDEIFQTGDSIKNTKDRIDDFGLMLYDQKSEINPNLPHYSKADMDALLLTENKPKFTIRDLSSKEINIKDIFRQICPDKFPSTQTSPKQQNPLKSKKLQDSQLSSLQKPKVFIQNQEEIQLFKQKPSPGQSPHIQMAQFKHENLNANDSQASFTNINNINNNNNTNQGNKTMYKTLDETFQENAKSPSNIPNKYKILKISKNEINQKLQRVKDIQSLTVRQLQGSDTRNLLDILNKFKEMYDYNSEIARFQAQSINTRRASEGKQVNPLYVNLFDTNRKLSRHIQDQQDKLIEEEHQIHEDVKIKRKIDHIMNKSKSVSNVHLKTNPSLKLKLQVKPQNHLDQIPNDQTDQQPQQQQTSFLEQLQIKIQDAKDVQNQGFANAKKKDTSPNKSTKHRKGRSKDFTNLHPKDPNDSDQESENDNVFAVDYEANKTVLPKIMDMHFIRHGDYLPMTEIDKKINTFREYGEKSKSIYNMLKEKQRDDRRKFLDREEEKYKLKAKGKKFDVEEKEWEQKRIKQIKESSKFKKGLQNHLEKGQIMSERQFKQKLNVLDVKFTKEFIREEALENKLFEKEKLKIKQDIYLTRQHNKEMRKKNMFNKKNPDLNSFKD
eukprot:403361120